MRRLLSFLTMKYKNSSFQNKLFLSYFVLIFFPLIVLSFFSYNRSAQVITAQSHKIASIYLSQTEALINEELQKMLTISQIVSQNSEIREVLETADSELTFSEEYDEMERLYDEIIRIKGLYEINQIRLYISQKFRYNRGNDVTYNIQDIEKQDWYIQMVDNKQTNRILPPYSFQVPMSPSITQISMVTLIRSRNDYNKIIGAVFVDMPVSQLSEYLSAVSYTPNSSAYIIDNSGNHICSSGNMELLSEGIVQNMIPAILEAADNHHVLTADNIVFGASNEIFGNWRIISAASFHEIIEPSSLLKKQLIIFSGIIGLLAYVLAYLYARSNTKRLKNLTTQIKKAEQGNFSIQCIVDSEDDIGELQNSFNFMVRRINTLLFEQYELGQNLQKLEMKVLQAQINPHFLYNTLNLISWKAKNSNNHEIEDIVHKLARFYQISLSNGIELIPMKNEFEHIRLYVALQNMRVRTPVELRLELEPKLNEIPVIKLLLQPIVENSIEHGILNQPDKQGIISVQAKSQGRYICIVVSDNGIGMDNNKIREIQAHESHHIESILPGGFGLFNVIDRLKAHYGESCSFLITSGFNEGTKITIIIPNSRYFENE